jgi:hypothetical protein
MAESNSPINLGIPHLEVIEEATSAQNSVEILILTKHEQNTGNIRKRGVQPWDIWLLAAKTIMSNQSLVTPPSPHIAYSHRSSPFTKGSYYSWDKADQQQSFEYNQEEHLKDDFPSGDDFLEFLRAPSPTDTEISDIEFRPAGQLQELLQNANAISEAVQSARKAFLFCWWAAHPS